MAIKQGLGEYQVSAAEAMARWQLPKYSGQELDPNDKDFLIKFSKSCQVSAAEAMAKFQLPKYSGQEFDPTDVDFFSKLSKSYQASAAEAMAKFQLPKYSGKELDPNDVDFFSKLSKSYQASAAEAMAKLQLKLDPNDVDIFSKLSKSYQVSAAEAMAKGRLPKYSGQELDFNGVDFISKFLKSSLQDDPACSTGKSSSDLLSAIQGKGSSSAFSSPSTASIESKGTPADADNPRPGTQSDLDLSQQENLPLPAVFMNDISASYERICQAFRFPGLQFNERQLEYLVQRILQPAVKSTLPRLLALDPDERTLYGPILKEFLSLIKLVEALGVCCTNRNWWVEALTKADGGLNFKFLSYELLRCISLAEVLYGHATDSKEDDMLEYIGLTIEDEEAVMRLIQQPGEPDVCDLDSRKLQVACDDAIHSEGNALDYFHKEKLPVARYITAKLEWTARNRMNKQQQQQQSSSSRYAIPDYLWIPPQDIVWQKPLGQGAYGAVHEVHWLGNRFAAKLFQTADDRSFKQEADILSTLQHPYIVQLWGYCIDRSLNTCTLLIDLMEQDLFDYLEARAQAGSPHLSNLVAVSIMLQIAEGMLYLHNRGVMHRDLKAKNVLVERFHQLPLLASDGYVWVKVCDFGLAKTKLTSSNFTTPHVGTSYWRAPEVFKDEAMHKRYTKKADVYSFAMTCAEILTAKPPFDQILNKDLYTLITAKCLRPSLPSSCPPYLAAYLQRCWATDPGHRPPFSEICRMLRHLKGLLIRAGSDERRIFSRLTEIDLEEISKNLGIDWCISECLKSKTVSMDVIVRFLQRASKSKHFASSLGLKKALVNIGDELANWKGSKHDFGAAIGLFEMAAGMGHAEGQWKLGLLMELGLGAEKDEEEAVRLYLEEAAEQDHANAYVELGRCFDCGRGVQLSDEMAAFYWERAVKHQIKTNQPIQSVAELIDIVTNGSDEMVCEKAAVRLWELSVRCSAGRTILAGPNNSNIAALVAAVSSKTSLDIGKHMITLMLANLSSETEMGSFILNAGGVAALVNFLSTKGIQNYRWRSGILTAFEKLFEVNASASTSEAVKRGIIPSLLACLRHDPSLAGRLLIQCLQAGEAKAWLSKRKDVVMAMMRVQSTAPGVSSKHASEMKQHLSSLGFDML